MKLLKTTEDHKKYWKERKIDWKASYQNWEHPHRFLITQALKELRWLSLFEIGMGGGANLINISKQMPNRQLGGMDINADAVDLVRKTFKGGMFKTGSADNIFLGDNSVDVVLSDMCLIYAGNFEIDNYIKEIKRISRKYIVLCEFHSDNFLRRVALKLKTGYNAYDYKKLLSKHKFYDISFYKIPEQLWPGGEPQKTYGYLIVAKTPKRK